MNYVTMFNGMIYRNVLAHLYVKYSCTGFVNRNRDRNILRLNSEEFGV